MNEPKEPNDGLKNPDKVKAAKARADSLTSEQRREIASKAAQARWGGLPQAEYEGSIRTG